MDYVQRMQQLRDKNPETMIVTYCNGKTCMKPYKAARSGDNMYVYDEAGKQVRWLMYRLEQAGVKDYYFMKGGA